MYAKNAYIPLYYWAPHFLSEDFITFADISLTVCFRPEVIYVDSGFINKGCKDLLQNHNMY